MSLGAAAASGHGSSAKRFSIKGRRRRPVDDLQYYEKCLAVDPAGENSVAALRGANAMRNYKKKFRGSWKTFCVLLFVWPAAIVYYFVKRK